MQDQNNPSSFLKSKIFYLLPVALVLLLLMINPFGKCYAKQTAKSNLLIISPLSINQYYFFRHIS